MPERTLEETEFLAEIVYRLVFNSFDRNNTFKTHQWMLNNVYELGNVSPLECMASGRIDQVLEHLRAKFGDTHFYKMLRSMKKGEFDETNS